MTDKAINPAWLGAKIGLCAGLLYVAYLFILYLNESQFLFSPWIFFGFIIIVLFKIAGAYILWKRRNNHVPFKDALSSLFMVSVISLFLLTVFYYLMLNYFDPALMDPVKKKIAENATKSFDENRITKVQLDEAFARIENLRFGAGAASIAYSLSLFIGFFYSLVFAAITRLISKDIAVNVNR